MSTDDPPVARTGSPWQLDRDLIGTREKKKGAKAKKAPPGTPPDAVTVRQLYDALAAAVGAGYSNYGMQVLHDGTWGWIRHLDAPSGKPHYNSGFALNSRIEDEQ
jgi:hypothetical protein